MWVFILFFFGSFIFAGKSVQDRLTCGAESYQMDWKESKRDWVLLSGECVWESRGLRQLRLGEGWDLSTERGVIWVFRGEDQSWRILPLDGVWVLRHHDKKMLLSPFYAVEKVPFRGPIGRWADHDQLEWFKKSERRVFLSCMEFFKSWNMEENRRANLRLWSERIQNIETERFIASQRDWDENQKRSHFDRELRSAFWIRFHYPELWRSDQITGYESLSLGSKNDE